MDFNDKLDALQQFSLTVQELEAQLDDLISPDPTNAQIERAARVRDALARCRGQTRHLIAELVIGKAANYVGPIG